MGRLALWFLRRQARRRAMGLWVVLSLPGGVVAAAVLLMIVIVVAFVHVIAQESGGCGTVAPLSRISGNPRTEAADVRALEGEGVSAVAAAAIVGNARQESGLNPSWLSYAVGVGLFQWTNARARAAVAWVTGSYGRWSTSAGQLAYVVYDLRTNYPSLLTRLNGMTDPAAAAALFASTYELCGACINARRASYAMDALRSASRGPVAVSYVIAGGTCTASWPVGPGGLSFVFPRGTRGVAPTSAWTRDQGVDVWAPGGTPELAVISGTIVRTGISGFGPWAPILRFDHPMTIAGQTIAYAYYGHAGPGVPVGTHVNAGQQIAVVGYGRVGMSTGPHVEFGVMPTEALPSGSTSGAAMALLRRTCGC